MAMGIVSDDDFEKELEKNGTPDSISGGVIIPEVITKVPGYGNHGEQGRNNGDKNVPDFIRNTIAHDYLENGRKSALELASSFGISDSSVSAYTTGRVSTKDEKNSDVSLKDQIQRKKDVISGRARKRLGMALNHITDERLSEAKLRDVASVAKDMAFIIKQMEPTDGGNERNTNVQVVLYAPKVLSESDFPRVVAVD